MARRKPRGIVSGSDWVSKFPTSKDVADLASPFRENVESFIAAMEDAGASIDISATYRPKERAYLMHYAYAIARQGFDPSQVPAMAGVDIDWVHRKGNGQIDLVASKNAAEDIVNDYGIVYAPALSSNHTLRLAIDMSISWDGVLELKNAGGRKVKISSTPRSGQNAALHKVGASYGVIKLASDPPHWSVDGR